MLAARQRAGTVLSSIYNTSIIFFFSGTHIQDAQGHAIATLGDAYAATMPRRGAPEGVQPVSNIARHMWVRLVSVTQAVPIAVTTVCTPTTFLSNTGMIMPIRRFV